MEKARKKIGERSDLGVFHDTQEISDLSMILEKLLNFSGYDLSKIVDFW